MSSGLQAFPTSAVELFQNTNRATKGVNILMTVGMISAILSQLK